MSDRNGARKDECGGFAAKMLTVFKASTSEPVAIVGASEESTSGRLSVRGASCGRRQRSSWGSGGDEWR